MYDAAIRWCVQPVELNGTEKPCPGTDGITRWKSSRSASIDSANSTKEPRPAVDQQQRDGVLALRPDVDEADGLAVDLGQELRQR